MTLPDIPAEAVAFAANAAHENQVAGYACADRVLRTAWPHLYAAALHHAAETCYQDQAGQDVANWLRRMADEATA